jgi:hypothetical protein
VADIEAKGLSVNGLRLLQKPFEMEDLVKATKELISSSL